MHKYSHQNSFMYGKQREITVEFRAFIDRNRRVGYYNNGWNANR